MRTHVQRTVSRWFAALRQLRQIRAVDHVADASRHAGPLSARPGNGVRYTPHLKNVPALASYNFDTRERILIFSGRNIADKVGNQ